MTKQEFRKTKGCIRALKWQNFWLDLRTFMTVFIFVVAGICSVFANYGGMEVADDYGLYYVSLLDGLSFFFLKIFGAFANINLGDFVSPTNEYYDMITTVMFTIGMLILFLLSLGLSKPKKTSAIYGWFTAISVIDIMTFIFFDVYTICVTYRYETLDTFVILWSTFVFGVLAIADIVTIVICRQAKRNVDYLNGHFEQGTALKVRELKKMYRQNREMDDIEIY